jgi:hypothetical protein
MNAYAAYGSNMNRRQMLARTSGEAEAVGYGTSREEMVNAGRYRVIYQVP